MPFSNSDANEQIVSLTTQERFLLIHSLNELPLTQFLELEYALNIPKGILPPAFAAQGMRSKALLEWIEGSTGPGINTLLSILKSVFKLSITQSDIDSPNSKDFRSTTSPLLTFSIGGRIAQMDEPKLRAVAELLKQLSEDMSIEIVDMTKGSIRFRLSGTPEGLERLRRLVASGDLRKFMGVPIKYAEFIPPRTRANRLNLRHANFSGFNLSRVNLISADLSDADLSDADLSGALLNQANLSRTNLCRANLSWATLDQSDLRRANLRGANLSGASFSGANVEQTQFREVSGLLELDKQSLNIRGAIVDGIQARVNDLVAPIIRRLRTMIIIVMTVLALISLVLALFNVRFLFLSAPTLAIAFGLGFGGDD